ncbi:MAG: Smr/MutS family protein [Treponema sp.]
MNFGDILDQWEQQTSRPYGKKRIQADKKRGVSDRYAKENTKKIHPIDHWINRYGIYDKDAAMSEELSLSDTLHEKKRIRALKPQDEIDLHGMTAEEACEKLTLFFAEAHRKGLKKLLIIHGKGNHSQGEPVLTRCVRKFLEECPYAGETGHPKARDGGSGSTWVILK